MKIPSILLCLLVSSGMASATTEIKPAPDKPMRVYVDENKNDWTYASIGVGQTYDPPTTQNTLWINKHKQHWKDGAGGGGTDHLYHNRVFTPDDQGSNYVAECNASFNWPTSSWPTLAPGTYTVTGENLDYWAHYWAAPSGTMAPPVLPWEHGGINLMWDIVFTTSEAMIYTHRHYRRTANTTIKLQTGGKADSHKRNLWRLNGSATAIQYVKAQPGQQGDFMGAFNTVGTSVPMPEIRIDGKALGSDGNLWRTYANNTTVDVTPRAKGKDFYTFTVEPTKHIPEIIANGINLSTNRPEFCVGQRVTFTLNGLPLDQIQNMVGMWNLPAKFVNERWQRYLWGENGERIYYGSVNYLINDLLLANTNQTSCWFVNKPGDHVSVGMNLQFNNGQHVSVAANGDISVYRPKKIAFNVISAGTPTCNDGEGWIGMHWDGMVELKGLQFNATVESAKFSGKVNWQQLDKRTVFTSNPADYFVHSTFGSYWLDNSLFYNTQGLDNDPNPQPAHEDVGPGNIATVDLSDNPGVGYRVSVTSISDSFKTYLVFNPNPDDPSNIWVTLGRADWGWSADAAVNFLGIGGASLVNSSTSPPVYTDTDEFPDWSSVIHNK